MTKHKPQLHRHFQPPKTCQGKHCYAHKSQAEAVKTEQELLQPGLKLTVYRCLTCRQWHLTKMVDGRW